jgi:hypothetical protein
MLPLHSATRMLATPSATLQSPVGSAANAEAKPVAKNIPEYVTVRMIFRGRCNMVQTYALVGGGKTPHWEFSVDEMVIKRSM